MPFYRNASPTSRSSEAFTPGHPVAALAFKLLLSPVLVVQAVATRRRAPVLPEASGARSGRLGPPQSDALRILIAGDSSAAGVGVGDQGDAVAGHLVRTLQRVSGRAVEWALHAGTGLTTRGVHALLRADLPAASDIAVVVTGVNDVTAQIPAWRAVGHRRALADWLLGEGLARHVVFAPLPPVHRFPLLPEPLRRVMGGDAVRHDRALARWASSRSDVSHAAIELDLNAGVMASDGFHPGEPVYRICGEALGRHAVEVARRLAQVDRAQSRVSPTEPAVAAPSRRSPRR